MISKTLFLFFISGIIISVAKCDYYAYYECNEPLLWRANVTATTSMQDRGPKDAILDDMKTPPKSSLFRIKGLDLAAIFHFKKRIPNYWNFINICGSSWSAQNSDFFQYFIIDLGTVMNVTGFSTRGRKHAKEFVMEYAISYGTNGRDYADYKSADGNIKMFKGNNKPDDTSRNTLDLPIVAQWIRINPTRWHDRISMRVELYGCEYVADTAGFSGVSLIRWDLARQVVSATEESLRFRFRTNQANGILLYSRGTQGDFFSMQLRENRMLLNINLGSGIPTSLSVGSLLDDNLWHDVVYQRRKRDVYFAVDRVAIQRRILGEFVRLDLNQGLYIGGVPFRQDGLVVSQNFTGCIENMFINSTNIIREVAIASTDSYDNRFYTQFLRHSCVEQPVIPVTFLSPNAHARIAGYEGVKSLNVSFSFRSYEPTGLLVYHSFTGDGYLKVFLERGKIKVEIKTKDSLKAILDNYLTEFADGSWHDFYIFVRQNELILSVDNQPMQTTRHLEITTGATYFIGGGLKDMPGFVGCLRLLSIDGNYRLPTDWKEEDYCCKNEIVFDACHMVDRCNPNPCKHGGICRQDASQFYCNCAGTGYAGAVCHTSLNPLSCEAYKNTNAVGQRADIIIDIDGSGPLEPFPVTCEFYADGRILTVLRHNSEEPTTVDGYIEPGSYVRNLIYEAHISQIEAVLNRSTTCRQRLHYSCRRSRLLNSDATRTKFEPFSWWVSRYNQRMDYWGGALPGSRKCECGILGTCHDPTKWCNCDSGLDAWLEDGGFLTQKEYLPVKQLRIGDTGLPLDGSEGRYTIGPLICEGDDLFNNVVTFRITDATIDLPTFDMGHSGDIYFEFKTTTENAVIMHSTGPRDSIKISINNGNQIRFQYEAGGGPLAVSVETSSRLADNRWHSVSVERNRKQARIVVDGALKAEVAEPPGPVRPLQLTSKLVVGADVEYRGGYVGCIRALQLNGNLQDLRRYASLGLYGVSPGCIGKCESNPCLNNGTCYERYDGYSCDCRWSAFKGPICADEIGVNLNQGNMIRYDFNGTWRSTISERIRVGFTTTNPKGFLLGFSSNVSGEYLTIMISNSGHLRVVFDFGFERREVIFPKKIFNLGQYHDVRLSRKNSGSTLVLQVDNYQPFEETFEVKESADAQFNNIQYLYIGKNESMHTGFVGCVSRVEFDDIYPLKLLFQQAPPPNVRSYGTTPVTEDYCGVEPVTHPPNLHEIRPLEHLDEDKVRRAYNRTDSAILGTVLAIIFVALVVLAVFFGRYYARHKGEYLTQEDKGAETALTPDDAVVNSTTGHQVQQRKEWFI